MVAPLSDEAFWEKGMEAVNTGMRLKKFMLKKKITRAKCGCQRCGKTIHAKLVGPQNHVRMYCEGRCGMNLTE